MIDKVLGIGASFDYISPAIKVLGDLAHGGGYTFTFPLCDIPPREIELTLRREGVGTWGLMHVDGTTMISVRKRQAAWAYALLKRHDVPVENPPRQARQPKRKAQSGGVFGIFDEVFKR